MSAIKNEGQVHIQNMMQRNPHKVEASESVQVALDRMTENRVSALPVVGAGGVLIGIVTLKDLLPVAEGKALFKVEAVMTEAPATIRLEEPLREAARMMMEQQVHHLPVVGKDNRLVGVVSSIDFVRLVAEGLLCESA